MCERSQFELQLFADNKQRPVEVYWYMPSLQDFQCMLKSQEDIQHKQENIGVHFKAIWNMLTAVAHTQHTRMTQKTQKNQIFYLAPIL